MEDWEIWLRWERAFHEGKTPQQTHPALPEDRARHEELARLIGDRLDPIPEASFRARAEFRWVSPNHDLEARWILLEMMKEPNQALEPTTTAVTIRAGARLAPAVVVAHL